MARQLQSEQTQALSKRFRRFGEQECRQWSPLYSRLVIAVAQNAALLGILVCHPHGRWCEWLGEQSGTAIR